MKRIGLLILFVLAIATALAIAIRLPKSSPTVTAVPETTTETTIASPATRTIQSNVYALPQANVHVLTIPANGEFAVTPALSDTVDSLETFAEVYEAIAVLNGGFFDPLNQKTTSYVFIDGELVADPANNDRLMNNADLSPYLDQILNRTEFRRYRCPEGDRYDITLHQASLLPNCQLIDALGGGPGLLPLTAEAEGFLTLEEGVVIRDAIGSRSPNARSAVGITDDQQILLVMVAQHPSEPLGLSLLELAELMRSQGATKAMNLDGGSSSSLYVADETFYGKVDTNGEQVQRPVKSVLVVRNN